MTIADQTRDAQQDALVRVEILLELETLHYFTWEQRTRLDEIDARAVGHGFMAFNLTAYESDSRGKMFGTGPRGTIRVGLTCGCDQK